MHIKTYFFTQIMFFLHYLSMALSITDFTITYVDSLVHSHSCPLSVLCLEQTFVSHRNVCIQYFTKNVEIKRKFNTKGRKKTKYKSKRADNIKDTWYYKTK